MSTEQDTPESQKESDVVKEEAVDQAVETEGKKDSEEESLVETEISIEELNEQLEEARQKAQENWDKALRIQAEMENLKRRTQKDIENAHKFALENFSKELLTVIDSLELGIQAASGDSPEVVKLREGSELTLKQLEAVFGKFNIEAVDPVGQPFNPEFHQAMSMHETADSEPNSVITVFQKGYVLNGRLIRPAMVVVAKAPEEALKDVPKIDEQA